MDRSVAPPALAEELALCLVIGLALFVGLVVEPLLLLLPTLGVVAVGSLARLATATPPRRAEQNEPPTTSHLNARRSPAR